jgi:K+-sensing histidine kinase KdpD
MDEKVEEINQGEKTIFKFLRDKTDNINISPDKIIINSSIALLLLLILFYLLSVLKKNRKAKLKYLRRKKEAERIKKSNNLIDMDYHEEEQTNSKESFNALKTFSSTMKDFTEKADTKQIAISHYIDPNIPISCVGNLQQIKQVLANLLDHAINSTKSYGTINVRIENSAEKEEETAIKFSIIESGIQISEEYRHKIMRSFYNEEILKTENLRTKKRDLVTTAILVANMDGIFEINNSSKDGTIISFAVSVKKTNQFDTKSLVA